MKIPKTVKISYSYNIGNMNRTRLRFTTSTSAYNVWILLDAHNTSAVGKTDCVYTNNNATVLRSWGGGASGNISYTDTIDVATQCPNCFTDGETVCDFSLTSVLTYAGYATNPCYIKSLEIYC